MGRPSKFSPEFREQAVELVKASGKTVAEVARDLQINDTTLGNWVKAEWTDRGFADETGLLLLTAAERDAVCRRRLNPEQAATAATWGPPPRRACFGRAA